MKKLPGNLTPSQLKVYEVVQHIRMAWVTLACVLGLLSIGFCCFLYAMFFVKSQEVAKGILGGIDALLAWALKIILNNLFPSKSGDNVA
jgi:hypothetical protein